MADLRKAGAKFAKAFEQASNEAEAAYKAIKDTEKTGKLEEALKAKQAPMTTPSGTGLPLMPRSSGMYTPGVEQKDLPRMPMVDKARAKGEKPKYTERMQDLLDSPTARKKVDTLIEKGDELGMREWYGTEPLRQVAMDIGMSQKDFDTFLAQMASASQRNPVDQQNRMGSYLWHLSQTGGLPEDAFLLTNKIKRGKQERPEGTAIELPPGYGSLAQGDIFSRGKQIASGDIEGALPPDKKLGTFYRNYQGNLKPVTVDVNAVRGPIIERGDPRWLASKLVEKDEEGNVIATHFPRKQVESGLMSIKQAKERPGFWEAAPSGSEYAGFEDLWQRAAKRKGVAPAEAQALGWYGSADVTALKTKPELYIENLERMIRRTAEQTGQNPRQVMEDVLRGKTYLKKKGGKVSEAEYQKKLDAMLEKHFAGGGAVFKKLPMKADGGVIDNMTPDTTDSGSMNYGGEYAKGGEIKSLPWRAAGGGWAKAGKAIQKAAKEAGMAAPQTAEKDLTTLQDFHTSLGDQIRQRVAEANKMMEGFEYKYDKGQRVFTKDSAAKNKPPYTILGRTRVGNQVIYDTSGGGMKARKDPETGKALRTPYEPGYRVRYEEGDDWQEFDIPAKAILGDVEMRKGGAARFAEGGASSPEEMLTPPPDQASKAKLMAEILARMAKEQGKEEMASLKKKGAVTDLINRGVIAPLAGIPVDLINMGLEGIDTVRDIASGKRVENRLASEKPVGGSEYLKDKMRDFGMTTDTERPMMETGLSILSPTATGAAKGAAKGVEAAQKGARAVESGLNTATAAARRPFSPATLTVEAVAPDLAQALPRQWQETATKRLITGEGAPVSMSTMGGKKTTKKPGQGVYLNEAGELETNPLVAIDVPFAGDLSKNKALRADIATAGRELNQEAMAAHRFVPMMTNEIKDASAMLIKPKKGALTNKEVQALGEALPGMIVAHNPRLGGVVIAPFEMTKGQVPTEFLTAQSVADAILGKRAKITYGKSEPGKDLMYMGRSDYATEGAREPSAESKAMRERLQRAEKRLFPATGRSKSGLESMRGVQPATVD